MQLNQLYKKYHNGFFYVLISFFFSISLAAQENPLALSWDKTGCQQDVLSVINFDDILSNSSCLKVCKGDMITYSVIGGVTGVDDIRWTIVGGVAEADNNLSTPITWDNSETGSIKVYLHFNNGTEIERTICVEKATSSLILGWDKIGCQSEIDNVSDVKFESFPDTLCLKVCKSSKLTYKIYGVNSPNIQSINWRVTGGEANPTGELKTTITWNEDERGSIYVKMILNSGVVIEKTICITKLDSSLLLNWEKIDQSSVSEIGLPANNDENNCLLIYPESTVLYKIDGKSQQLIQSIHWDVTGGYAYTSDAFSTPVTWFDTEETSMQIHITFLDGHSMTRNINIVQIIRDPGVGANAPNAVHYDYDLAGNQKKRSFIYLPPAPRHKNPKGNSIDDKPLVKSDLYDDISYYPNPVKSDLFITWKNDKGKVMQQLELYDINGRLMRKYADQGSNDSDTVSFEEFPQGIYDLLLVYKGGEKRSLKIVKQ